MTTRRELLIALGAVTLAASLASLAQSKQVPVLIGWLGARSQEFDEPLLAAFKEGLAALGWKEGFGVVFDGRWADGQADRLPALAQELAAKRPALILATPVQVAAAAAKAAPKTPIVIIGGDPVASGFVKSLARPGGMITGVTSFTTDISEKYLELLLAATPKLRRFGFLLDSTSASPALFLENARRSVAQHKVEARFAEIARPEEIEPALSRLAKEAVQALILMPGPAISTERRRIVKFALTQRWPLISNQRQFAEEGALLSYSVDAAENSRRAAYYVDRILKGAKPGDLPIEQPTKFELVVNMKTAKSLGLTLPQPFLMRADRVIE